MDGLTLRAATDADSPALAALDEWTMTAVGTDRTDIPGYEDLATVEASYHGVGGEFLVGVVPSSDDPAQDRELPPDTRSELRVEDGVVVTMGGYLPNEAGHEDERTVAGAAELHRMRVAPPLQGRGIGRRLLAELEARVRAAGFDTVLATTARHQTGSVEFYASAGYEQVGQSQFEGYDLVHFEKRFET